MLELSSPPIALTGITSDRYIDRYAPGTGAAPFPPGRRVLITPSPRDDGRVNGADDC